LRSIINRAIYGSYLLDFIDYLIALTYTPGMSVGVFANVFKSLAWRL